MSRIQLRRGTAAQWTSVNPTLYIGELGFETDTLKIKIGDGVTAWNSLAYTSLDWTTLANKPAYIAAGSSKANARSAIDAEYTGNKGSANGYASLDSSGLVPLTQLPVTQADWTTLEGKPTYVAAGATKADARSAIDAEYVGNKGQANGYASLDSSGYIPLSQWGAQVLDGGSAAVSSVDVIDGGTA